MPGAFHERGRSPRSVRHNETLVSARVRAGAQPLPYGYGEVRGDFQNLYHRKEPHPPGLPLETHVDPVKVNDEIPTKAEVEASVRRL